MKPSSKKLLPLLIAIVMSTSSSATVSLASDMTPSAAPTFSNVSVHDPSVIRANGTYYVFGSHLASAKTNDLMRWTQISSSVHNGNPLIPNVLTNCCCVPMGGDGYIMGSRCGSIK